MCVDLENASDCSASGEIAYAPEDINLSSLGSLDYHPYSQNITNDNGVWKCNSGDDVTTNNISTSCPTSGLSLTNGQPDGQSGGYRISQTTLSCNNEIGGYLLCYDKMKTDGLDNTDEIIYDHATGLCTKISSYEYTGTNHQILQATVDNEDAPYVLWSDGSITAPTCSGSGYTSCNTTIDFGGNWCQVAPGEGYCLEENDIIGMARSDGSYVQCNGKNEILIQDSFPNGPCPNSDVGINNDNGYLSLTGLAESNKGCLFLENRTSMRIQVEWRISSNTKLDTIVHGWDSDPDDATSNTDGSDDSPIKYPGALYLPESDKGDNDDAGNVYNQYDNQSDDPDVKVWFWDGTGSNQYTIKSVLLNDDDATRTRFDFQANDDGSNNKVTCDGNQSVSFIDEFDSGLNFRLFTLDGSSDTDHYYIVVHTGSSATTSGDGSDGNGHIIIGKVSQLTKEQFINYGLRDLYKDGRSDDDDINGFTISEMISFFPGTDTTYWEDLEWVS